MLAGPASGSAPFRAVRVTTVSVSFTPPPSVNPVCKGLIAGLRDDLTHGGHQQARLQRSPAFGKSGTNGACGHAARVAALLPPLPTPVVLHHLRSMAGGAPRAAVP